MDGGEGMTAPRISPCPFCGSRAMSIRSSKGESSVGCTDPGCDVVFTVKGDMERAISMWNRLAVME